MKEWYKANETMKLIGRQGISEAEKERQAIEGIITGMGLPMTSDNIMLATNALEYGIIVGVRKERQKHNN